MAQKYDELCAQEAAHQLAHMLLFLFFQGKAIGEFFKPLLTKFSFFFHNLLIC